MKKLTPMMKQYMEIKEQYKDCIIFFRLGDFYEMFFEDAITASRELEITLTQRNAGMADKIPMAGIPHHVSETYISRLVEKGYKVAICDQIEDAAEAKGLVKRDVIRVVTPGTITDQNILDEKSNNYLVSVYMDNLGVGISYVDNSTGEMYTTEFSSTEQENYFFALDEIGKISPSEIISNKYFTENKKIMRTIENNHNPYFNIYNKSELDGKDIKSIVFNHFKLLDMKKYRGRDKIYSITSTAKLIEYLHITQKNSLEHINTLTYYEPNNYMILDINTRANLEIHETIINRDRKGALIGFLDKTSTSMGGRLLKKWLEQPLINIDAINNRSNVVEYFIDNIISMDEIKDILKGVYDIERLASKISNGNCNARDLISIKHSIYKLPKLREILINTSSKELNDLGTNLDTLEDLYKVLNESIKDEPPIGLKEGGLIKSGYSEKLDKIREICLNGRNWLTELEAKEKENTGIRNLKIGYNRMSGYFFEVTKANIPMVPDYFIRRQTLTNSERYYTDELKSMEDKILGAEEKSIELEYEIFTKVRNIIKSHIIRIQSTSKVISMIDVLNAFGQVAYRHNFTKANINNEGFIDIIDGRHPVVENTIESKLFIPNDTHLDLEENMIQIITGPNMSGKSTYMRQVAIITLLAHVGSFVPATSADIPIVDRIFTRIGAADNLSQGESTFMVEMNEVSNIIKSASKDSLIILDEVGRGTSTYDGLSIAWAVVEHIAKKIRAKTMFATHYHELTQLEKDYPEIKNMTIIAEEKGDSIVFLRKIIEGSTNRSYGIEVAKLAGIDKSIINRASEILTSIESSHQIDLNKPSEKEAKQINVMDYKKDYYLDKIINIDIDNITAREALDTLYELKDDAKRLKED